MHSTAYPRIGEKLRMKQAISARGFGQAAAHAGHVNTESGLQPAPPLYPALLPYAASQWRFVMSSKASKTIPALYKYEPLRETPGRHDLTEVEHLMVKLAKQFEDLFKVSACLKDQQLDAIAERPEIDAAYRSALRRPRVRIGQQIVDNYFRGNMPLVDDIIYTKFPSAFIDRVPALRGFSVDETGREALEKLWKNSKLTIPNFVGLKRNINNRMSDSSFDGEWPPPLPAIEDEALLRQVFTHRSFSSGQLSAAERSTLNNERLEFKGDTVLGGIVVDIIFKRFPQHREGELSKLKSRLVCNALLGEFSLAYDLPSRLLCSQTVRETITANPDSKIVADIFEAYIGGVEIFSGYEAARDWLEALYEPLIMAELDSAKNPELDKSAKTELYRIIGADMQCITYNAELLPSGEYAVECSVNGEVIGKGVGPNKRDGGNIAAMNALKNTEAIRKYSEQRLEAKTQRKKRKEKASSAASSASVGAMELVPDIPAERDVGTEPQTPVSPIPIADIELSPKR